MAQRWSAPIVHAVDASGRFRLLRDYKSRRDPISSGERWEGMCRPGALSANGHQGREAPVRTFNPKVAGSRPARPTRFRGHFLALTPKFPLFSVTTTQT